MEDEEKSEPAEDEEEEEKEESEDEERGVTFDEIVSFTMLVETLVTVAGIIIFFLLFVLPTI